MTNRIDTGKDNPDLGKKRGTILVAFGGSGARAVAEVSRQLRERLKLTFGKTDPETDIFVEAIIFDGDQKTFDAPSDRDAVELRASGAHFVSVYDPNQDQLFKQYGLYDVFPEDSVPSSADPAGCNSRPNVSAGRWYTMDKASRKSDRPMYAVEGVMERFRTPDEREAVQLGAKVELLFVGSGAGGTGTGLLTDAASQIKKYARERLERGAKPKKLESVAYVISSQGADFDDTLAGEGQRKVDRRRYNFGAFVLRMEAATTKHGVMLADGKTWVNEVPANFVYIINGESDNCTVDTFSQPADMVARAIVGRIAGRGPQSVESNYESGVPGKASPTYERALRRWGSLGTAELHTNPSSEEILRRKKSRH